MTVSIRSVLHNTQFKRADPVVEVEGKDLDTPVRWVFTNEREDVSSFLSGGEMLIIEGNALLAADWHGTLGQYVASLAQAGVAALVVELVEGVVRMPDELVSAARLHGLTLIGLLRPRRGRDAEPQRGQPRRLCRRCRTGCALYCCAGPRLLHDDRPAAR